MNSLPLSISDITPTPDPSPAGPVSGSGREPAPATAAAGADVTNLSPLSQLAQQALDGDPGRVEQLRLQFQAGAYTPSPAGTAAKLVAEQLANPLGA